MFIALSSPFIQKFSNRHAPFVWLFVFVLFCFVFIFCGISHTVTVDAQMIHFDSFYHLSGTHEWFRPQRISFFRLGSWKKSFRHSSKKKLFRSEAFILLSKFETSYSSWMLTLLGILKRTFFVISGASKSSLFMTLLQTKLASCCKSYLVEFLFCT